MLARIIRSGSRCSPTSYATNPETSPSKSLPLEKRCLCLLRNINRLITIKTVTPPITPPIITPADALFALEAMEVIDAEGVGNFDVDDGEGIVAFDSVL